MEGAKLQQQIDDLRDSISDCNSKISALADHLGLILEFEPKTFKVMTKEEAKKEEVQTVRPYQ